MHRDRSGTAVSRTSWTGPRTFLCTLLVVAVGIGAWASGAVASPAHQAVAYQGNPTHDGHIADAGITTPLAQAWAVTLPGIVSYPLIVNGRVYVTTADKTLYALNQATGAILWSRAVGGTYFWSGTAYDRGQLFVVNGDGLLTAVDPASGSVNWSKQLPGQYSFSSEPTAIDGVIYVGGSGSGGTLYAVREHDGHVLWTRSVANGDHSSPAVSGDAVFVSYACHRSYAFHRVTGALLWDYSTGCSGGGGRTPVVANGHVLVRDTSSSVILSAATGAALGPLNARPAPAVKGDVAFALHNGTLRAISQTGRGVNLWSFTGDGGLASAPFVVGDRVYIGSSSGMLYGLDAAAGTVSWSENVGSEIRPPDEHNVSEPVTGLGAANGTLIVPAGSRVVAYRSAGPITQAPVNQSAPAVDGKPQQGQILAADVGTWSNLPSSYSFAWQRCDGAGANCADVGGATSATFIPVATDIGSTFRVRVIATNAVGASAPVVSAASSVVTVAAPANQTAPTISGQPRVGETLQATVGTWSPAPTSFAVRWQRCSSFECITIPGATGASYVVGPADLGERLRVAVTATNAGGDGDAVSAQTQPVQEALPVAPTNLVAPSFLGFPQEGETLFAQPGSWTGAPTSYSYQWFTCAPIGLSCPNIPNATGQSYVVRAADVDRFIGVEVVATNAGGSSAAEASDALGPVPPAAPKNQQPPSISGVAQVGQTLTALVGTWTGAPTSYRIQWYRCDVSATDCSPIASATSAAYVAVAADAGSRLGVGVIATNRGGDSFEEGSYLTGVIAAAAVVAPPPPPPTVMPLADNTFTMRARARSDGSIAITLKALGPGRFEAVATAPSAALARGCRRCTRSGRGIYGRGSSRAGVTGAAQLAIRPRVNARRALRHSRSIGVRVRVTFRPASGGATASHTRTVSVKGRRARARSAAARTRGARVLLALPSR